MVGRLPSFPRNIRRPIIEAYLRQETLPEAGLPPRAPFRNFKKLVSDYPFCFVGGRFVFVRTERRRSMDFGQFVCYDVAEQKLGLEEDDSPTWASP